MTGAGCPGDRRLGSDGPPTEPGVGVVAGGELPAEAWALALAGLGEMGPARLVALLTDRDPARTFALVRAGRAHRGPAGAQLGAGGAALAARWARELEGVDVAALWHRHVAAGVGVAVRGAASYPQVFVDDPHPPALVIWRGQIDALDGPRAAVVGTRDCTGHGHRSAYALGHDLARAGVRVVSGLALGIDGAAHAGALDAGAAPPIAVVGSGLDVPYPRRNTGLWHRVAAAGWLLTEHPLGTSPSAWHFPARNRLIAAVADVVVVVESHGSGGALLTVREAQARGRTVLAVPGPLGSPASVGTNDLLADGAEVCRDAADVLVALGLRSATRGRAVDHRAPPDEAGRRVLDELGWRPAAAEQLLARTGWSLAALAITLDHLEADGWVARRGGWYERVAEPRQSGSGGRSGAGARS